MKHSLKIFAILIGMFLLTEIIGLFVLSYYAPNISSDILSNSTNITDVSTNLPFGLNPPKETSGSSAIFSLLISLAVAVALILILMRWRARFIMRLWFFIVVLLSISISVYPLFRGIVFSSLFAFLLGLTLAYLKLFKKSFIIHNFTELLIYPGVAALLVPILTPVSAIFLLIIISAYDAYAVWHSGFMQKMAMFQIKSVGIFSGLLVPYSLSKKSNFNQPSIKENKKTNVAILGGGDIVFPLILAGTLVYSNLLIGAIGVVVGATLGLVTLLLLSEKGKFYPAMPFISAGSFLGLLFLAF